MTGLAGPRFWEAILAVESARCARYARPATVVLAALVGLDRAGDEGAPQAAAVANRAIAAAARVLEADSRSSDYLARLGRDRFGLILTETSEIAAINFVERVRERCERALAGGAGIAFGWAGATAAQTLVEAVAVAEGRLQRERAVREPPDGDAPASG